jgi:two-component system, LuxR family, response regulator FixJ
MSLIGSASNEIFIVDDDDAVCDLLAMVFTAEGYQVTNFRDGTSFIPVAQTRVPACVLLDVYMPVKSGIDILKELANYPAPIFIMSGSGDIPTAVQAVKTGAVDFLEKRLGTDALVARVREALDRQPHRQHRAANGHALLSQSFPGCDRLTRREYEVLSQIVSGASSKEAAKILGISQRTIEVHRLRIMHKLGAKNAVDLALIVLSKRYST